MSTWKLEEILPFRWFLRCNRSCSWTEPWTFCFHNRLRKTLWARLREWLLVLITMPATGNCIRSTLWCSRVVYEVTDEHCCGFDFFGRLVGGADRSVSRARRRSAGVPGTTLNVGMLRMYLIMDIEACAIIPTPGLAGSRTAPSILGV